MSGIDAQVVEQTFFQARLKVGRANRHIEEAQHWFNSYIEGDFHQVLDEKDLQTGEQILRVVASPIPADLVLAIGDAFHCLSAALEYLMSGLMRAKTGNSKRIHFPTNNSRDALRRSFKRPPATKCGKQPETPATRRIVEAFPLIAFELLCRIRPYKGGPYNLWEVRKADNIDKHNLIIPGIVFTELTGFRAVDKVHNNTFAPKSVTIQSGGRLNMISYSNGGDYLEIEEKGQASATIVFSGDMEAFGGKPVFTTLLESSRLVTEAIDRIEAVTRRYL